MIEFRDIEPDRWFFVLIRENRIMARVQQGPTESDVRVELAEPSLRDLVRQEVDAMLLAPPESMPTAQADRWDYMREFCFKFANLQGPFLWAGRNQAAGLVQCGFDIEIRE